MYTFIRVPVIRSGDIMPDACPVGKEPAAMPVGGVIATHNTIIPASHSSDICCSLFATFYEARGTIAAELDALTTATRLGTGHRHLDDLVHHPVLDENVWTTPFLFGLRDRLTLILPIKVTGITLPSLAKQKSIQIGSLR